MFELINYLKERSDETFILHNDRILFTCKEFLIFLELELLSKEELDNVQYWYQQDNIIGKDVGELDRDIFSKFFISKISITDFEYLGDRQNIKSASEMKSITNRLYQLILQISSIDKNGIKGYNLDLNHGYGDGGYMCNAEPNFIFNIYLKEDYFTNNYFFDSLLDLSALEENHPPVLYQSFYKSYRRLEDSSEVNILNANTKARRLGYLKVLALFVLEVNKVPVSKLNVKFENYALEYSKYLFGYKNTKGLIQKTKTGNSANPYISLAYEIEWLTKVNTVTLAGKQMKVYLELNNQLVKSQENIFALNDLDRLFFLERLLGKDFFYISIILELLYTKSANSYSALVKLFQPFLLQRLYEYTEQLKGAESKITKQFKLIQDRIQKWTEPEKYLEHVLMPRINWLFDLGLVDLVDDIGIELTSCGRRLFEHFNYWNDINYERVINPSEFLNLFYVHLYDDVYRGNENSNKTSSESIKSLINLYINETFLYFKTLAPNRVTASQAITYVKYKLYLSNNICVDSRFVENYLKNEASNIFVYKFQKQYQDGYIQKIRSK